jgi:hypothetical protein
MSADSFFERRVDIWLPAAIGVAGLVYLLHLADRPAIPNSFQIKIYVVVLALSSASFASLIPGMLSVQLDQPGLRLRAIGALAVFLLILFFPPAQGWLAAGLTSSDGGQFGGVLIEPSRAPPSTAPASASPSSHVSSASERPPLIRSLSVAKSEWHPAGGDGQGGTLLFYDIEVPGRIVAVNVARCTGCGGWFWLCPDPRCGGRQLVEMTGPNRARVWAATNNGDATSTTFDVRYQPG